MADRRNTDENGVERDVSERPVTRTGPAANDPEGRGARVYDRPARTSRSSWPTILIILLVLVLLLVWIF